MTFSPLPAFLYRQQKLRTHSWLEQFRAVGISKRVVDISTSAGVGYYSGVRNMPKKKAHEGPDGRVTRTQEHAGPSAAAQRTIFEAPSTMLVSRNPRPPPNKKKFSSLGSICNVKSRVREECESDAGIATNGTASKLPTLVGSKSMLMSTWNDVACARRE